MKVFILEDDLFQQQYLKRMIERIVKQKLWSCTKLIATSKPKELLTEISQSQESGNIYFLDIEIKGEQQAGLDLAKRIRLLDPFGQLIFVSTHSEFLPITFKYKLTALDFIDKGFDEQEFSQRVEECLDIAFSSKKELVASDAFVFKNQHSDFQVPFADILFFETTEITHKIRLITKNRYTEFYANLQEIETLDQRLYRCHRSYVINVANIQSIDRVNRSVLFDAEEQCMIARNKVKTLVQKLEEIRLRVNN
jgi:two-component system response regulator AgrA